MVAVPPGQTFGLQRARAGLIGEDKGISVIDCDTGKRLVHVDSAKLAKLLHLDHAIPGELALSPDGRLMLSEFSTFYGRNGHVVDPTCERLESSFEIDASPKEWSLSGEGRYLSLIADDEVLSVRDLQETGTSSFAGSHPERP